MSVKSKNPTGVYVVGPSGSLVTHPVHVSPGVDFPSDEQIVKSLKPGWRLATPGDVKAKADAEAARQRAERGEPAKSDKQS